MKQISIFRLIEFLDYDFLEDRSQNEKKSEIKPLLVHIIRNYS